MNKSAIELTSAKPSSFVTFHKRASVLECDQSSGAFAVHRPATSSPSLPHQRTIPPVHEPGTCDRGKSKSSCESDDNSPSPWGEGRGEGETHPLSPTNFASPWHPLLHSLIWRRGPGRGGAHNNDQPFYNHPAFPGTIPTARSVLECAQSSGAFAIHRPSACSPSLPHQRQTALPSHHPIPSDHWSQGISLNRRMIPPLHRERAGVSGNERQLLVAHLRNRLARRWHIPVVLILLSLLCTPHLHASAPEWSQVPEILQHIVPPTFPAHEFVITDYGALGDGTNDASPVITQALAACRAAGGGRVTIPAGIFLTGPIHLPSNVELHLNPNATLKFDTNPAAYLPAVFTRYEGIECYNYSPLIYAFQQTNVAITGSGTLDGQATDATWLAWRGRKGAAAGTQTAARKRLDFMNNTDVPVDQRRFGTGDFLRPDFIQFNQCRNVLIEGVRIRQSPMWEIHPLLCTNVIVRGVDILSHGANNDGCDPESCRDVLIEGCSFDTGDDCIAIKSGRNNDGHRVNVPSANLIIRHCTMRDGHAGTAIGSEVSGGCSNVFVEDCEMSSPNLVCALRLKSNAMRGGTESNIFMRNVHVGQVADSVLQINFLYEEGAKGPWQPVARNIVMDNITVDHTPRVLNITGFPAASITGIRINDSTFKDIEKPDVVKNAEVQLVNCTLDKQY